MTDEPVNSEPVQAFADPPVDPVAWPCVFALFQDELDHAAAESLARGTPADQLAEHIEERIAQLRRQLAAMDHDAQP